MQIATENRQNAMARKEKDFKGQVMDRLKEDDLLKHNTNKYSNWIR